MTNINFDFSNVLAKKSGADGLTAKEFSEIKKQAEKLKETLVRKRTERKFPFAELPYHSEGLYERFYAPNIEKTKEVLVLGMGGSSLGVKALAGAIPAEKSFRVLDNIDPDTAGAEIDKTDIAKTLVCVVTKSGSTAETLALFSLLSSRKKNLPRQNIVFITANTESDFAALAGKENFKILEMPKNVSGRFSVLTAAGLFPAYAAGYPIDKILEGARDTADYLWRCNAGKNPALLSALILHSLAKKGKTNLVFMPYADRLQNFAHWYAQLLAESLGKRRNLSGRKIFAGLTPVVARGASDQHSHLQLYLDGPRDKIVSFVAVDNFKDPCRLTKKYSSYKSFSSFSGKTLAELFAAERRATAKALTEAGCPNFSFSVPEISPRAMGALFYFFEFQVVALAELFGVNPFDQPGVEAIKRETQKILRTAKEKT